MDFKTFLKRRNNPSLISKLFSPEKKPLSSEKGFCYLHINTTYYVNHKYEVNYNMTLKWISVIIGSLIGLLTVCFFSSEGLVQFYRNGMGSITQSPSVGQIAGSTGKNKPFK